MNKEMRGSLSKVLFYAVTLVMLIWTGRMTVSLIDDLLPEMQFAGIFGVVLFEVGMLAYLYLYINGATSQGQRVTALLLTLFDLFGIGAVSVAKLYLSGQTFTEVPEGVGTFALWAVILATFVNLAGGVAYHLYDADSAEALAVQAQRDKLRARTLEAFGGKVDGLAETVSNELGEVMAKRLLVEMRAQVDGQETTGNFTQSETQTPTQTTTAVNGTHKSVKQGVIE